MNDDYPQDPDVESFRIEMKEEGMTQAEAIELLEKKILEHESVDKTTCTGHAGTCPNEECYVCGVRDCPGNEPLHYHHDGCPYCWNQREKD